VQARLAAWLSLLAVSPRLAVSAEASRPQQAVLLVFQLQRLMEEAHWAQVAVAWLPEALPPLPALPVS